jgi:CO/xanthine dehydrogenase Mo-binding subunit
MAALQFKAALDKAGSVDALEGQEFSAEYLPTTDPLNSTKENPYFHVAYSYATQVVILNDEGKVEKVVAAYDVGTPVNLQSVQGQIEGGVTMGLGYALTENFILDQGIVKSKFGTLGLLRSTEVPPIEIIVVEKEGRSEAAYGSKGVGEISTIPTAPAAALAYYNRDGNFRTSLPLEGTPYSRK